MTADADSPTVHLFMRERLAGEGRTLQVVSLAACGAIVGGELGITTSILEVTCPVCQSAFTGRD
jgi:hypothetical protein